MAAPVVVVLLFIGVAERIAYRGHVMPGIKVASLDASGQRELEAYASIIRLARRLETEPLRGITSGHQLRADPAAVHLRVDATRHCDGFARQAAAATRSIRCSAH